MENVNNSIKKQSDMELSGIARLNLKDAGLKLNFSLFEIK